MAAPRDTRLSVRMTGREYDKLLHAAAGKQITLNEYCRIKLGLGPSDPRIKKKQQKWMWGEKPSSSV